MSATPAPPNPVASPRGGASGSIDLNDARPRRWGWILVIAGFGGFMAWAATAPLDAGVPSPGTVVVADNRKSVQPLVGGKIVELAVRDGDTVKAGQVLVRFDGTQARSQYDVARGQWFSTAAAEARLVAERTGRPQIVFPDGLLQEKADPRAANAMALQTELLATRRRSLESDLNVLRATIRGLEAQAQGIEESSRARREQERLLREEIERQRGLVADGFLARNRLSEQERALAAVSGAIADAAGNLGRTQQQIAELRARMVAREQELRKEVDSQLSEVQRDAAALTSQLQALQFELANREVRAPADGIVVGLAVHTIGGVVRDGAPMMEVVPVDQPLKIEAQVAPNLIDKVRPGLDVDILFPAFNQATTPHIPGRVLTVSADVLVEPKQGISYFKAIVEVTPEGMKQLSRHQIRAGMPAEVFVRTGERTLLSYLVKPLVDRLNRALTEP
ncbi:MAG: HlyD family type I secretion periplasmic adaptor subunit [Betaproteobacteria bacterium]|nr:HlyD family type I secretion periplasmic adaptor subunit [Betaproteobacteria bacterium]